MSFGHYLCLVTCHELIAMITDHLQGIIKSNNNILTAAIHQRAGCYYLRNTYPTHIRYISW